VPVALVLMLEEPKWSEISKNREVVLLSVASFRDPRKIWSFFWFERFTWW